MKNLAGVQTALDSSVINVVFGCYEGFTNVEYVLETVLRFIAIKHRRGDDIQGITCGYTWFEEGIKCEARAKKSSSLVIIDGMRFDGWEGITEPGWTSIDAPTCPINEYLSKESKTQVFANIKEKKTLVLVKAVSQEWYWLLASVLPKALPWVYDKKTKLSEDEISLFNAIAQDDKESFEKIINAAVEESNLADLANKKILGGWGDSSKKDQISKLRSEYSGIVSSIRTYELELERAYKNLAEANEMLQALELKRDTSTSEVYEFFKAHKSLHLVGFKSANKIDSSAGELTIAITDTIEYYDAEIFKIFYKNQNSAFHRYKGIGRVLEGLFVENKGVLRVESNFTLTNLSSLRVLKYCRSGYFTQTHLPHPHQYYYGCLGENGAYIRKSLERGDWDLALEQAIASVKNINFGDSVVMSSFVSSLQEKRSACKCIVADNGQEMTPDEFLKYLGYDEKKESSNG